MADDKKDMLGFRAVRAIAEALEQLDEEARNRVLTSALALVGMKMPLAAPQPPVASATTAKQDGSGPDTGTSADVSPPQEKPKQLDIRTLKEQKHPKTDIEMAVLMAYYLEHEAPQSERKGAVTGDDIKEYFKQADHPSPKDAGQTLINAKNAGYLNSTGRGLFSLNPVGYNLIAHNLPRNESSDARPKRVPKKASASKKTMKNKANKGGK